MTDMSAPTQIPEGFEWRVGFPRPAFEKRHDDPRRDYGIGCVMARIALVGPEAAVSFEIFTGWYLPHVRDRLCRETDHRPSELTGTAMRCSLEGHGGAMYTHHPPDHRPAYLGYQEPGECDLLPGGRCVGDVGFVVGDELFDALVEGGEDALAARVLDCYRSAVADAVPAGPAGKGWYA